MRTAWKSVTVIGALLWIAPIALCQSTDATLMGRVVDPQKATVPEASIEATNVDTNVSYTAKTNREGLFSIPILPPGNYRVSVVKEGFKSVVKPGIVLHVQDVVDLNFEMELGSRSEVVTVGAAEGTEQGITVYGEGVNMNTTDATVSTTIDRNFAENLPLNGRSFQTLILLTPGTVLTNATSNSNQGQFSVNGQRANSNNFTVDGVSANVGGFFQGNLGSVLSQTNGANPGLTTAGTTQGLLSVDSLEEFKIQTSTYAPEFGRQPGGQVALLTRSGTDGFHGTAFDYVRNDAFDANNWFNNQQGLPKGKERQNDFGGTFGGPVRIPRLYNGKDKTFFFFSYEGLRLLQPFTFVDTVPSLRLRQEAAPGYQPILDSWPIPDGPESIAPDPVTGLPTPTGGAPYTLSQSLPTNVDALSVRIDQSFARDVHVFGRYAHSSSENSFINTSNNILLNNLNGDVVTLGADWSHRLLSNELRVNYTSNTSNEVNAQNIVGGATRFDPSVLFPSPFANNGVEQSALFIVLPNSYFQSYVGSDGTFYQRQLNVTDSLAFSLGAHQLKLGMDYRRLFPRLGYPPLSPGFTVGSESDLAAGAVTYAQVISHLVAYPIYSNLSAYAQDSWRLSDRLMLTYGLRWEFNPAPGERDGIQPLNLIDLSNPTTAKLAPLNSSLYQTTYGDFAPRLGLAYQVRQSPGRRTVVRGGVGLFYDLSSETAAVGFGNNIPFTNRSAPVTGLAFPVGNGILPIPPIPTPVTGPYFGLAAIDPHLKLPFALQWNVSVEQALGEGQTLTASYVASAGYRLLRSDYLFNFNSNFNDATATRNAASSKYESLQVQFNRRLVHGLQALASYTYAHSIDDTSDGSAVNLNFATALPNPAVDRGNSAFDLRHAFRGAVTYVIPTWRVNLLSKSLLGGWSVDGIGIVQTGLPVDLVGTRAFVTSNFYLVQLRPNVVPGQPRYLYGSACTAANGGIPCPGGKGFNPAAFTPVPEDANGNPTQTQGTLGRNVMRGFGASQLDFALHRQFNLNERVNLQFRAEFFNVFNHPNFAGVDPRVGDSTFGQARSTLNTSYGGLNSLYQIGGPRSIQLALKLAF